VSHLLELIFESCGELLAHLEVEWRPATWFAVTFGLLAVVSLLVGLFAIAEGGMRNGMFTASAVCGIGAFVSLVVGHFFSDYEA